MLRKLSLVSLLVAAVACCQPALKKESSLLSSVVKSTVMVLTEDGQGSGTIVYSDGKRVLVLTCHHVIANNHEISIASPFVEETKASVEKDDPDNDLALLSAMVKAPAAMKLARLEPAKYERIYLMGSPLGTFGTISQGFIAEKGTVHWLVSAGFTTFGISGGTGFNAAGELVCIPEAVRTAHGQVYPQLGICIGLDAIKSFLKGYRL